MHKIGVLYGMEHSFPPALIEYINNSGVEDVKAEYIKVGALKMTDTFDYNVVLDRVSNTVPFYRSILKLAAVNGTHVINNPFWKSADDNFFNAVMAQKFGIRVPKTIVLPSKELPEGTSSDTMHNLEYPLDWDAVFEYVGFPAILKPNLDSANYMSYKVYNPNEFFSTYDLTGNKVMLLQEAVEYDDYFKVYIIGQKHIRIMEYSPIQPMHLRYSGKEARLAKKLVKDIEKICLQICSCLGFDFNAVEIAIKNGQVYTMDFLNPTPNADIEYLKEDNFNWVVAKTAEVLIEKAREEKKDVPEHICDMMVSER